MKKTIKRKKRMMKNYPFNPATTGGPPGNEHLAALTQHVDEVELTVRVLVLRGSRFARCMSCTRDYKIYNKD